MNFRPLLSVWLLGTAALAQPVQTTVGVLITSQRAGADAASAAMAGRVHTSLKREGLTAALDSEATGAMLRSAGVSNPKRCAGASACLAKLAFVLSPTAVLVSVDVGKLGTKLAVHLEAVSAENAEVIAMVDFTEKVDAVGDDAIVAMTRFSRAIVAKVNHVDRPLLEATPRPLVPVPTAEPAVTLVTRPSHVPSVVSFIAAGAFAVTATVCAVLGFQSKAAFDGSLFQLDGQPASHLTDRQLTGLASRGNTELSVALGAAIAAVVMVGIGVWRFAIEAP